MEININKLEPRTGAIEKRLAAVEQDMSSKVKPRFNVVDAKIAELTKKLKEGGSEAGPTSVGDTHAEVTSSGLSPADMEQLRLEMQEMVDGLRGEVSEKLELLPSAAEAAPGLDDDALKKLLEQLRNELDEQVGQMNKNFNLFKEKVAVKDELFDVLAKLKKLEERVGEGETRQDSLEAQQKEQGGAIHENEERSKDNATAIEELRNLMRQLDKKLNDKADESDLEELRQFINVLSVQSAKGGGGAPGAAGAPPADGKEAPPPPMMMPQTSSKDSKRIKELIDKMGDLEERVGRNTTDLQKLKDVKEKQKHLAALIDKKGDIDLIKKLQSELDASNTTIGDNRKDIISLKKQIEAMPSFDRLEKSIL